MAAPSGNGRKPQNGQRRNTQGSTTRKTASTRNTASSGRKVNNTRNSASEEELDTDFLKIVIYFVIIAFALFLFLCTLGVFSSKEAEAMNFCDYIASFMFGTFGFDAYILPIVALGLYWFARVNAGNVRAIVKTVSVIVLIFALGIFSHLIAFGSEITNVDPVIKTFYDTGIHGTLFTKGGGVVFGYVCYLISKLISHTGCVFLMIVLSIVSLFLLFDRQFKAAFSHGSDAIKKGSERIKDEYNNLDDEESENSLIRAGRKVSGVTFNTELTKKESAKDNKETFEENDSKAFDLVPSQPVEEPVKETVKVKKKPVPPEKKDIHRIIMPEADTGSTVPFSDEDDWLKPVSKEESEEKNTVEADVISHDIKEISPDFSPDNDIIDKDIITESAPVLERPVEKVKKTHLRSADKHDFDSKAVSSKLNREKNEYVFPPIELLKSDSSAKSGEGEDIKATALKLQEVIQEFGVKVTVTDYSKGPSVTRYELQPEHGVSVKRILALQEDIKLNLAASDIRIEAPIPGKSAVGIEVPNKSSSAVLLGDMIRSEEFKNSKARVPFTVGKDIAGANIISDISKMPHMLVAGTTGSGKSVCINSIIMSVLYKATPDDIKLIMIDPKVVELSVYNGIPHLITPVITDPKKASLALKWAQDEMQKRYNLLKEAGVRNIEGYNEMVAKQTSDTPEADKRKKLPYILLIVDEFADLMQTARAEVEESVQRLAALARAAGIHLVIATQRPSVDVITGVIKANIPSRIALSVSNGTDSRTIIDQNGAEKLLGHGDMLFFPSGIPKPVRVQGCYVSDEEISNVVDFVKNLRIPAPENEDESGIEAVLNSSVSTESGGDTSFGDYDEFFVDSGRIIIETQKASIGFLQRKFRIGFNRAARIMDQLEEAGCVGPDEGTKPRQILMSMDQFEDYLSNNN